MSSTDSEQDPSPTNAEKDPIIRKDSARLRRTECSESHENLQALAEFNEQLTYEAVESTGGPEAQLERESVVLATGARALASEASVCTALASGLAIGE